MAGDSQKFIARNRAPRVQIEYDVELYGAEKKVQLPFVMGVMSDLSGKSTVPVPAVEERSFLEIDVDNFDDRMAAMAPRARFSVPNTLSGDGNLPVDITFARMDDFSPAAVASKVEPLRKLLEARTELATLMAYMDGKAGAEALVEKILASPEALQALAQRDVANGGNADEVLAALRAETPTQEEAPDGDADVLAALAAQAPTDGPEADGSDAVLDGLRSAPVPDEDVADATDDVLGALRTEQSSTHVANEDSTGDVLSALAGSEVPSAPETDVSENVLDALRNADIPEDVPGDESDVDAVLSGLPSTPTEEEPSDDSEDVLSSLREVDLPDQIENDMTADALDSLRNAPPEVPEPHDVAGDILADLAETAPSSDAVPDDDSDDTLEALRHAAVEVPAEDDASDDILAGIAAIDPPDEGDDTGGDDVLDALRDQPTPEEAAETSDDILSDLAAASDGSGEVAAEDETEASILDNLKSGADLSADTVDPTEDVLSNLAEAGASDRAVADDTPDVLDALRTAAADGDTVQDAPDDTDDILSGLEAPDTPEDIEADVLNTLRDGADEVPREGDATDDILGDLLDDGAPDTSGEADIADDVLGDLIADDPVPGPASEDADGLDDVLASASLHQPDDEETADADPLDDLLGTPGTAEPTTPESGADASVEDDLDDLLGGIDDSTAGDGAPGDRAVDGTPGDAGREDLVTGPDAAPDPLDDLLGDLGGEMDDASGAEIGDGVSDDGPHVSDPDAAVAQADASARDDLDALLGDPVGDDSPTDDIADADVDPIADDLDALLDDRDDETGEPSVAAHPDPSPDNADDLDDLLGDLGAGAGGEASGDADDALAPAGDVDDLDAFLGDPDIETTNEVNADAVDAGPEGVDDLDALLGDLSDDDAEEPPASDEEAFDVADTPNDSAGAADPGAVADVSGSDLTAKLSVASGILSGARPDAEALKRDTFRIAIFGDFTGRSAAGKIDIGDGLAARRAIPLDVDEIEEIIEGFATTLTLPLGEGSGSIEVRLGELDDLHPDEVFENVDLFSDLGALRQRLDVPSMADGAIAELTRWGETHAIPLSWPSRTSRATSVPADMRLTDFQKLIGDTERRLAVASPVQDLLERAVGPHVVAAPGADAAAMKAALDEALSAAMRLVLHHPDFQAIESQWRSLDLLARSIETDQSLQVVLYDVSAEELAADLTGEDDLAASGLMRLLGEQQLGEEGPGGFSALFGLYQFEETPPHADLLARIARVAAHVDAPFITSISAAFLDVDKEDRHPLVADAWDRLRAMPEAAHLGIASPRFLLRRPYGARTEPCDCFDFEEFTLREGLSGMLWANPVVLVAILMARSFKMNGKSLDLGSVMSMGGMPYQVVTDAHGDQVALPCTERNLTTSKMEVAVTRGFMPILSIKGRDEVRLGSFQSVAGQELLGPWSGVAPPPPKPESRPEIALGSGAEAEAEDEPATDPVPDAEEAASSDSDLDDLLGDLEDTSGGDATDGALDDDLDALLAGFSDDADGADASGDEDLDADLAALLEDL